MHIANHNLNWLLRTPIAHRGLHDARAPENSLAAFRLAMDAGYPIELDVRLTADEKVIVFHDDNLKRLTGFDAKVSDCNYDDTSKLRLLDSNESIPLLSEVLSLVDKQVSLLIEIKDWFGEQGKLEQAVINHLGGYRGEYAVQSFNPLSLVYFRKHAPHIPCGQLSACFRHSGLNPVLRFALRNMLMNWIARPHFIACELNSLTSRTVTRARAHGLPLLAWTVRTEEQQRIALRLADNYIFEIISPHPLNRDT